LFGLAFYFHCFLCHSPSGRTTKRQTSLKDKPSQSFEPTKATAEERQRATIRTNQDGNRQPIHTRQTADPTDEPSNVTTIQKDGRQTVGRTQPHEGHTQHAHAFATIRTPERRQAVTNAPPRQREDAAHGQPSGHARRTPHATPSGRQATKQAPTMADPTTHDTRTTHERRERFTRPFDRRQ